MNCIRTRELAYGICGLVMQAIYYSAFCRIAEGYRPGIHDV
jgi:hypothetical protein